MAEPRRLDRRRIAETAFVAAVAAGTAWAALGFWYDHGFPGRFDRVHLGMERNGVEAILGGPDWDGPCAAHVDYLPRADCSRELGWSSAFAPVRPLHYIVQLDRSGKVVEAQPAWSR
jgi:hypothetical protein